VKHEHIGKLDLGIEGWDAYYLVSLTEREMPEGASPRKLQEIAHSLFDLDNRYECRGPGTLFCTRTSLFVHPQRDPRDGVFLGIAHIRRDC